jgi:hypothetical protein
VDDLRKAAEMALGFAEFMYGRWPFDTTEGQMSKKMVGTLRQALAQPEQYDQTALELCEKCGWKAIIPDEGCLVCARNEHEPYVYVGSEHKGYREVFPLYRAPPKREWVGLSNVDKVNIRGMWVLHGRFEDCLEATEAKLKEKNHGRI